MGWFNSKKGLDELRSTIRGLKTTIDNLRSSSRTHEDEPMREDERLRSQEQN